MPPSLWAALLPLVVLSLWLVTRRRPVLLRSTDTAAVAALNRAQISSRVLPAPPAAASEGPPAGPEAASGAAPLDALPPLPRTAAERRAYRKLLRRWWGGDAQQRLRALAAAERWRDPSNLPLLRRGLRDVDPRVIAAAAAAITPYRSRPAAPFPGAEPRPWRRVSRTR
ncbi:MAG: HEAT repeat domain-containing protein [Synechococcaceae cyanobacterium]|nr:HEAT repeat domain-containing protein [Synechococcaceae cyanobacterium]